MRIAQGLSIGRTSKSGAILTVRSAARFTRGRSGRTRSGPVHRHESERGHSPSRGAGEQLVSATQSRLEAEIGGKFYKKGAKSTNMLHVPKTAQLVIL